MNNDAPQTLDAAGSRVAELEQQLRLSDEGVSRLAQRCTLSLEADGSAMYGGNAVEAVLTLQEMGAAAVGLNCSVGPDQLEAVVASMKEVATVPIIAKPNAGMPFIDDKGEAHYDMNADDFARHTKHLVEVGAGIVGGCCGTTPEYIRKLAKALARSHHPRN